MKLSLAWLKNFITIPDGMQPELLADLITTSIAEVEGWESVARENVVVAKVLSVTPHPNADRLRIAAVTDGKKTLQVVCGGTNLAENQLVALAYVGAKVRWHGEGEEITLERATLRGVESEGMICASSEIGLKFAEDQREILDLTDELSKKDVGRNLYDALGVSGEVVFEIDNKSLTHRPDLFSHYGFARDIACILRNQMGRKAVKLRPYATKSVPLRTLGPNIRIQSDICQAFSSVVVENVTVKLSPLWLRQALLSVGVRPINNIVDITNYVMLELGQPMHAYDYRSVSGKTLVVRKALEGEKVLALNGKTYELSGEDEVVSDLERPLLITGIMGCENSGVTETTTSILLEAGSWNPVLVRKMSQRLGLRSDASTRFEKDLDPHYTTQAIVRAVELIRKLLPKASVTSALFEYSRHMKDPREITLDLGYASRLLGMEVDPKQAKSILKDLGCAVKVTGGKKRVTRKKTDGVKQKDLQPDCLSLVSCRLSVMPPTWRSTKDLLTPEDLIEEIGRVLGYKDIPYTAPSGTLFPHIDGKKKFERTLKGIMSKQLGYHEVENYSLTTEDHEHSMIGKTSGIEVVNPLSRDLTHFKASLLPHLLENAVVNARMRSEFRLFEVARLYRWEDNKLVESRWLAVILVQDKRTENKKSTYDTLIFRAKEDVEELLSSLRVENKEYSPSKMKDAIGSTSGNRAIDIIISGKAAGRILEISDQLIPNLDLFHVVVFEINLDILQASTTHEFPARSLPRFPESVRDIALIVDAETPAGNLKTVLKESSLLIREVSLFDVFEGPELGEGKHSLAYRLILRADDHTLTEDEIGQTMASVEQSATALGATVRK